MWILPITKQSVLKQKCKYSPQKLQSEVYQSENVNTPRKITKQSVFPQKKNPAKITKSKSFPAKSFCPKCHKCKCTFSSPQRFNSPQWIKSKNVLVKKDGHTCCLADFGLALKLNNKICARTVTIGKYDGVHPCLTAGTLAGKVNVSKLKIKNLFSFCFIYF